MLEEQPQVGVCSVADRHLHVNGIPKQLHHWVVTGSVIGFIVLICKRPKGVEAIKPELGTSILPETEHIQMNTSSRSYYWAISLNAQRRARARDHRPDAPAKWFLPLAILSSRVRGPAWVSGRGGGSVKIWTLTWEALLLIK